MVNLARTIPIELWVTILAFANEYNIILRLICQDWNGVILGRKSNISKFNTPKLLQFAINHKYTITKNTIQTFVRQDNLTVLKYIYTRIKITPEIFALTAQNLRIAKWFKDRGSPWSGKAYTYAVLAEHPFDVINWLKQNNCPTDIETEAMTNAVHNDPSTAMSLMKWLHTYKCRRNDTAISEVLLYHKGHAAVYLMEWLRLNSYVWNRETMNNAILSGDWIALHWLRENNCMMHTSLYATAARLKRLDIIKWLHPLSFDEYTFRDSIKDTTIEILDWLLQNGCVLTEDTFTNAIFSEDIAKLEWCKKHKCPYKKNVFNYAIKTEKLQIVKWMKENDYPYDAQTFNFATGIKNLTILQYLLDINCPTNEDVVVSVAAECFTEFEVIKWLHNKGFCINDKVYSILNRHDVPGFQDWFKEISA